MHLYFRRSLAAFFIIFFLVSFLPLIFITSGKLYNPKKHVFEETTLLIVESVPKRSEVLLNNRTPETWWSNLLPFNLSKHYVTPIRLNYLLPDTYELSVTHQGYYDWRNTITLAPGQTTILDEIKLWPNKEPVPLLPSTASVLAPSPSLSNVAFMKSPTSLSILSMANGNETQSFTLATPIQEIIWSDNENHIALVSENEVYALQLSTGQQTRIPLSVVLEKIVWEGTNLYLTTLKGIERFDAVTGNTAIFTITATDWDIYNGNIAVISENALTFFNTDTSIRQTAASHNDANLRRILYQDSTWLYVNDVKGALLRYHKPSAQWHTLINEPVDGIFINASKNRALWWNEFEVGTLHLDTNKTTIHTRLSTPLRTLIVDESYENNHHLAVTGNKVLALDALFGDAFRTRELFSLNNIQSGYYDEETKTVFLLTNDNGAQQIWSYPTLLEN